MYLVIEKFKKCHSSIEIKIVCHKDFILHGFIAHGYHPLIQNGPVLTQFPDTIYLINNYLIVSNGFLANPISDDMNSAVLAMSGRLYRIHFFFLFIYVCALSYLFNTVNDMWIKHHYFEPSFRLLAIFLGCLVKVSSLRMNTTTFI